MIDHKEDQIQDQLRNIQRQKVAGHPKSQKELKAKTGVALTYHSPLLTKLPDSHSCKYSNHGPEGTLTQAYPHLQEAKMTQPGAH